MTEMLCIWFFEWLWCLSDLILKPRKLAYDKGFQRVINCGKYDVEAYRKRDKKRFILNSEFGYEISCELVEAQDNQEKKIAILCHGFGCAKYECIKYAELFIKLGFTVLMYDHRNHGLSGKAFTSMGYYEKYDLRKVIDWCYSNYGRDIKVVTHGESMGAATVLLHMGIDRRVSCVIADCPYSDLKQLLCHQLKQYYHLPCFLIPVESFISYLRAGFWFEQVSPIKVVSQTDTPVLFVHGKRDNLVPANMSKQMYACRSRNKAIYLVAKARHAESYCMNREGYEKRVKEFLDTYL